jgi:hypothetical protein
MTAGTIHAVTANLFIIEGEWPSAPAAVYRCSERLCLLDSGAGKAQRAAIRAVAVSYGAVDELVLLSSSAQPRPHANDDLLDELPARRRRHMRLGGVGASQLSARGVSVEDYADLGGPGSVLVASRRWPGWTFQDCELDVLRFGPPHLDQVGFHIGSCRALLLPCLPHSPSGEANWHIPIEATKSLLTLLDDHAVDVVSLGFGPPIGTTECRELLLSTTRAVRHGQSVRGGRDHLGRPARPSPN